MPVLIAPFASVYLTDVFLRNVYGIGQPGKSGSRSSRRGERQGRSLVPFARMQQPPLPGDQPLTDKYCNHVEKPTSTDAAGFAALNGLYEDIPRWFRCDFPDGANAGPHAAGYVHAFEGRSGRGRCRPQVPLVAQDHFPVVPMSIKRVVSFRS